MVVFLSITCFGEYNFTQTCLDICDDGREELEEQAIEKAITEARSFMKQPRIIKSDEVKSVKKRFVTYFTY